MLPDTPREAVERFERDMLGMPRYIDAIRNWAFSRADPELHPTPWTHVWEQEYRELRGLQEDYMLSPYHWGLVDGWYDPESPQRIVDTNLAHVYCPAATTILGWGVAGRGALRHGIHAAGPSSVDDAPNDLVLLWSVPGPEGFWTMRVAAVCLHHLDRILGPERPDETAGFRSSWWAESDALTLGRERKFMLPGEVDA